MCRTNNKVFIRFSDSADRYANNFINIMALTCLLPTRSATTNLALCGLVLLIICNCKTQQTNAKQRYFIERFQRHLDLVKRFPCRAPQPRTISIRELLGDHQSESWQTVQPHMTILHRCDKGTGYCGMPGQECKVAKIENVTLVFYVTDTVLKTPSEFREYTVTNHTECSCQAVTDTIK